MSPEQQQLLAGIAALEAQRALLGDAVVDASLTGLRARLASLQCDASPEEPAQALKQVSILFLDVVGSTTLSQHLDPEDVHAVMDGALSRCTGIVVAHRGKVLQYAGDNLLAVFGAEEAREDDAERAVRCGLALLAEGRMLGSEVQATHGHAGFDVRVGIHTGGVLLGGGVDAEGSIRGLAVNVAARMEQTAPAGTLRISHDTYAQARGIFDVEVQPPLMVKGVDVPVQSYLVRRARPRAFRIAARGIEGVTTRMIGRDAELAALQRAHARLFAQKNLAVVTVAAEAGIGKSRLLHEFEGWMEKRPEACHLFRGRATPQTLDQPFGLLRDIFARRLGIADDDTLEAAREKLANGILPLFVEAGGADLAEGHAHFLGHLIGIEHPGSRHLKGILDDPRQIRTRGFHAAAELLRRSSASDGSPVVLELEDLHWADSETLDFLSEFADADGAMPVLILCFTRPTLFERRADWPGAARRHQRIDLAPLDKRASLDLTLELLINLPEIPDTLRELVTAEAEGNPFYMEELIRMLIDQGAIATGERWTFRADKLAATQVPTTLTGVLQARLDGLPAPEKLTLQEASVIGPVFWDQALVALDARAEKSLPALQRRELALPRADTDTEGVREFAFQHHLLHQVTYNTVLKRTKRALHHRVAHWLAGQTGLRANDFLGIIAQHFEHGGDDASAVEFHARAAERAGQRFAHAAVLEHVKRALELSDRLPAGPGCDALRWRLIDVRERTLDLRGERAAQHADIGAMERLAESLDDDRRRAHAAWRRSNLCLRTANYPMQEEAARRTIALAERAGVDELRLLSLRLLALARAMQGDPSAGASLATQCLSEARALGFQVVESSCLNALAMISAMQDDVVRCLRLNEEDLSLCRAIGNRRGEAIALGNVAMGWFSVGEIELAERDLEESLRLVRANGDRALECGPLCELSALAHWQGDDDRAVVLARTALDTAVAVGARDYEAYARVVLGDAQLALGRCDAAKEAYEQGRTLAQEIDHPVQHDATAGLARLSLAQGDLAVALSAVERLLAHAAGGGAFDNVASPRQIELTCHHVLAEVGDSRAAEWLERAHRNMQARAATITDAGLRHKFLANIPEHRAIAALWASRQPATQS